MNVNVPVRETVIKLKSTEGGGLWIHNPVAPTPEHLAQIRELEATHGPVRHIVLGSLGLEHKALAGPFAAQFPDATVWLQPGQWSFPLPTPNFLYGFSPGRTRTLPNAASRARAGAVPWEDEIAFEVLGPLRFKAVGAFGETAFFHKATKSLLVTDAVVRIDDTPPPIIAEDPRALLFHARDDASEEVRDNAETRRKGWRRIVQFGLIFFPEKISVASVKDALGAATRTPSSMQALGDGAVPFNLYPWAWAPGESDEVNFRALQRSGRNPAGLLVAPILRELILNRDPAAVLDWVDRVGAFPFKRVIPCHLANDVKATPADFRAAFAFLDPSGAGRGGALSAAPQQQAQAVLVAALAALGLKPKAQTGAGGGPHAPGGGAVPEEAERAAAKADLALLGAASSLLTDLGVVAEPRV